MPVISPIACTRVAVYARVSSDRQARDQTIASQLAALRHRNVFHILDRGNVGLRHLHLDLISDS